MLNQKVCCFEFIDHIRKHGNISLLKQLRGFFLNIKGVDDAC